MENCDMQTTHTTKTKPWLEKKVNHFTANIIMPYKSYKMEYVLTIVLVQVSDGVLKELRRIIQESEVMKWVLKTNELYTIL